MLAYWIPDEENSDIAWVECLAWKDAGSQGAKKPIPFPKDGETAYGNVGGAVISTSTGVIEITKKD